jgi:hypothetical protein
MNKPHWSAEAKSNPSHTLLTHLTPSFELLWGRFPEVARDTWSSTKKWWRGSWWSRSLCGAPTGGLTPGTDLPTPAGSASFCARRAWWQTKDVASLSFQPDPPPPPQPPISQNRPRAQALYQDLSPWSVISSCDRHLCCGKADAN